MATPLESTPFSASAIKRVRYTHDAMIDLILAEPSISQNKIAEIFGVTQAWVSRVFNSDAFQARLAQRKTELVDPVITFSIEERMRSLAAQSMDVLEEKLSVTKNENVALKALEITTKALGFGARQQNLNMQANFVVAMPGKAQDAQSWASAYSGRGEALDEIALPAVPPIGPELQQLVEHCPVHVTEDADEGGIR